MEVDKIKNIITDIDVCKDCLDTIKNTLPSDINEIIINFIKEGNNIYSKNNITHPKINKYENWELLCDNWNYSIYFTCNLLYFENIKIKCFLTKKIINSIYSNTICMDHGHMRYFTYYFFSENENSCILFYGGPYNLPLFIYYFEKNECYNLIYAPFGDIYGNNDYYKKLISNITSTEYKLIKSIINDKKYVDLNKISKRNNCMFFANNYQAGHYLWNEISGLEILIRTKLINNIDTLLLGDYDICDIHKTIKEYNPSCKIINVNEKENYKNFNNFGFISGHFILNKTKELYLKNITSNKLNKKNIIMIIIKADRRCLHDMDNIYIKLINKLVENNIFKPSETTILFDGLYNNNCNLFLTDYFNSFKDNYKNIIDNIISNIDKNIECKSLIGLKFTEIISYYNILDFWIGTQSSTIEIIQQINKNGVIILPDTLFYTIEQQCSYIEDRINHPNIFGTFQNDSYLINFEELYNIVEKQIKLSIQ
jgi:hypothetical protein